MRKEELSKSKSTTIYHFVKTCLAVLYAKKIQLCALFLSITRPQNNFHYQIRNPGNDPGNGIVAGLLISCCNKCNHHFLCLSKSRCCVYRNRHNTCKKIAQFKIASHLGDNPHATTSAGIRQLSRPFQSGALSSGGICTLHINQML